jgi:hypothetical protein
MLFQRIKKKIKINFVLIDLSGWLDQTLVPNPASVKSRVNQSTYWIGHGLNVIANSVNSKLNLIVNKLITELLAQRDSLKCLTW